RMNMRVRTTTTVREREFRLVGRTAQLRGALALGRLTPRLTLHRLQLRALPRRRCKAGGGFHARGLGGAARLAHLVERTPRRACHQHLMAAALMAEIAIGEAHAGDRAAEAALVALVEIEAGLERNALDRCAHGLAADLQGVAGQADMADRA